MGKYSPLQPLWVLYMTTILHFTGLQGGVVNRGPSSLNQSGLPTLGCVSRRDLKKSFANQLTVLERFGYLDPHCIFQ